MRVVVSSRISDAAATISRPGAALILRLRIGMTSSLSFISLAMQLIERDESKRAAPGEGTWPAALPRPVADRHPHCADLPDGPVEHLRPEPPLEPAGHVAAHRVEPIADRLGPGRRVDPLLAAIGLAGSPHDQLAGLETVEHAGRGRTRDRHRIGELALRQPRLIQHEPEQERLRRQRELGERRRPLPLEQPRQRRRVEVQAVVEHVVTVAQIVRYATSYRQTSIWKPRSTSHAAWPPRMPQFSRGISRSTIFT